MRAPSLVALALFALTLALKFNAALLLPSEDKPAALTLLAANFGRVGYTTTVSPDQLVIGRKAGCSVALGLLDAHGTAATDMARMLAPQGRIMFARGGQWHKERPRIEPLLEYYVKREWARQGFATTRDPVWIAAIATGCTPIPDARLTQVLVTLKAVP